MNLCHHCQTINANPTKHPQSDRESTARSDRLTPIFTKDYLDRKTDELSLAKQRFAAACYYAMLAEGLTWYEIFLPVTGNLSYKEHGEVARAFDRLCEAIENHGIPNLTQELLASAEEYF
ncbi:MAG: hypothetical protein J7647_10815 [Cyanobacteria bacterium SBLK]|nr:hypothetical protein [Cyanobacteria bacterium SBLK]